MKVGEIQAFFCLFSIHLQILSLVCVSLTLAEPPSSYLPPSSSYGAPSSSYGAPGNGLLAGHGGGYQAVGSGYQESEGAYLDPSLLQKIEEILLDQENQGGSSHGSHGRKYMHLRFFLSQYYYLSTQ